MVDFTGDAGDNIFTGGADADTAAGAGGDDTLNGNGGNDILSGDNGADELDGGEGRDSLYSGMKSPVFNLPNNDPFRLPLLDTGTEVDTLRGGGGDDQLFAGYGDNVDGGGHSDFGDDLFISFIGAPTGVTADLSQAIQVIGGGTIANVENARWVQGSDYDDDITTGVPLRGHNAVDAVMFGMGGNDTLTAGFYKGFLDGGDGNDILFTDANGRVHAYGGAGDDTIYGHGWTYGGAGNDLIILGPTSYPGEAFGEDGNDEMHAASSGSVMLGGAGADILIGDSANDTLVSAHAIFSKANDMDLEQDQLTGGGGDDKLAIGYGDSADGSSGYDTLRLSLGGLSSGATLDTTGITSGPFVLGGGTIQNIEDFTYLLATDFADTLVIATQATLLTVDARDGDDIIYTSDSSVAANGGNGEDRFVSGAAGDVFDGGAGIDVVDYGAYATGITLALGLNAGQTGIGGGGDQLIHIENVYGSAHDDTLSGSNETNLLLGNNGDDALSGMGGDDTLIGGAGADALDGGDGTDLVSYAGSIAGVYVRLFSNTVFGGHAAGDTIANLEDVLGSLHADDLIGSAGANVLEGGAGDDKLHGIAGDDILIGGTGGDMLDGGVDTDTLSYVGSSAGVYVRLFSNTVFGGDAEGDGIANFENARGSSHADDLIGSAGANVLEGGAGGDKLNGLAGDDTLSYAGSSAGVYVRLFSNTVFGGDAAGDSIANFENARGSSHNDDLIGSAGVNVLEGGAGNDILHGLAGDDILIGGAGADRLYGGEGNNTVSYAGSSAGVVVSLGGNSVSRGDAQGDYINGFRHAVGSSHNDNLGGSDGVNTLDGGAGNDQIWGQGGIDTLNGGDGDDVIDGGAGNDVVNGGDGNDVVNGDAGDDVLNGGVGADRLSGGDGIDTLDYFRSNAVAIAELYVRLFSDTVFGGDATGDTISGFENVRGSWHNDDLIGSAGDNLLEGGVGNDKLHGIAGDDILSGGLGSDALTGGVGADIFRFEHRPTPSGNIDTIFDYSVVDDAIQLEAEDWAFTGLVEGILAEGAFRIGAAAADADDRIIYDSSTGALLFDADGTGGGVALQFATLSTGLALTASEFFVM